MKTLSRRTLLGAGGIAAVGAGAVAVGETHRGRRWLHAAGVVKGPDLSPPDVVVPVSRRTLASRSVKGDVAWAIAVPDPAPAAIVLCLHGRHASHEFAFEEIGVHRFVAASALPFAVASVDGGASSYWHQWADGTDVHAMVIEELLPAIRRETGDVPVVLVGWSMGGYGALLAAGEPDSDIVAVAAASPAIWRSFDASAPGAFDSAEDFATHDLFARAPALRTRAVRIDCGRDDPFFANAHALAETVADESTFDDGFHDAGYWRSLVPAQLDFFRRALGG